MSEYKVLQIIIILLIYKASVSYLMTDKSCKILFYISSQKRFDPLPWFVLCQAYLLSLFCFVLILLYDSFYATSHNEGIDRFDTIQTKIKEIKNTFNKISSVK